MSHVEEGEHGPEPHSGWSSAASHPSSKLVSLTLRSASTDVRAATLRYKLQIELAWVVVLLRLMAEFRFLETAK